MSFRPSIIMNSFTTWTLMNKGFCSFDFICLHQGIDIANSVYFLYQNSSLGPNCHVIEWSLVEVHSGRRSPYVCPHSLSTQWQAGSRFLYTLLTHISLPIYFIQSQPITLFSRQSLVSCQILKESPLSAIIQLSFQHRHTFTTQRQPWPSQIKSSDPKSFFYQSTSPIPYRHHQSLCLGGSLLQTGSLGDLFPVGV